MTSPADTSATDSAPPADELFTSAQRRWVLGMLLVVGIFNSVDRGAIGLVQEPLRKDLGLTDFQLGLLGGPAFALLYTFVSIPLARLADRRARVPIIAACLSIWSLMTALCGFAWSFSTIFLCRLGVSVGEAGSGPASQSVVVDYYPPERRATALSILGLSTPLASLTSGLVGGWLAQNFGWRVMFVALGLPGLLLGALLFLTVREPPRRTAVNAVDIDSLPGALRALWARPTIMILVAAVCIACFAGYGVSQYFISFLMRSHHLSLGQGALFGALVYGVCAAAGTLVGGTLTDRLRKRFPRIAIWLPALGLLVAGPCYMLGYQSPSLPAMTALVMTGAFTNYIYVGVMFAVLYELVPASIRSTSAALLMLAITLIGYGLGPPTLGLLSDHLAAAQLQAGGLTVELCKAATGEVGAPCEAARAAGLGRAIVIMLSCYVWAGLVYLAGLRTIDRDRRQARADLAVNPET